MVKKINKDAFTIKGLMDSGMTQAELVRRLGIKRQKVSYWANREPTEQKKRLKKFN